MAFNRLNEYGEGDRNLTSLMNSTDAQRRGLHRVTLTNYSGTALPKVARGSVIEVGGALLEAMNDLDIAGTSVNGNNYIVVNSVTFEPTWSQSSIVWNEQKQGYYTGDNRALNFKVVRSGATYTKYELLGQSAIMHNRGGDLSTNGGNVNTNGGDIDTNGGYIDAGHGDLLNVTQITFPNGATIDTPLGSGININQALYTNSNNIVTLGGDIGTNGGNITTLTGNISATTGYFDGKRKLYGGYSWTTSTTRGAVYTAITNIVGTGSEDYVVSGQIGTNSIFRIGVVPAGVFIYNGTSGSTIQCVSGEAITMPNDGTVVF